MELEEILNRPSIPLHDSITVGSATAEWIIFDEYDNSVVVLANGPDHSDRYYAQEWLKGELLYHGYKLAEFDMPEKESESNSLFKTSSWQEVMEKAKRLVETGKVHILRNGYHYIVANVQGDHGDYEVEISRQDPNSRAITGSTCTCQWGDHMHDRTRKWKRYESRPCSHCLATYWASLGMPLDDAPEGQPPTPGQRINPLPGQPAPGQTPGQAGAPAPVGVREPVSPQRSFGPDDEGDYNDFNSEYPEGPGPFTTPINTPSGPSPMQDTPIAPSRGIIPPFPGAQMEQWQNWQGPGTTDGGQESPPWAVSVPGAKQPNPFNPMQWPGTYSSYGWEITADYQSGQIVQLTEDLYMNTDPSLQGGWQVVPARKPDGSPQLASVRDVDPSTGFIQIWVSLDDNGPKQAPYAFAYVDPSEIKPSQATNDPTAPRRVYK